VEVVPSIFFTNEGADIGQVVVTMAEGMFLDELLCGKRGIPVHGNGGSRIQLLVTKRTDGSDRHGTVLL
jgi:hypothetical protein